MAGRESNTVIRRYQAPLSYTHIRFVNGKKVTEKVKIPLCDPVWPVPNSVVANPGISNQATDSTRNQISSDACAHKMTSTTLTRVRTKFTEEQLAKMKRLVDDGVIKRTTVQESKIIIDMATELNLEPKIVKKFLRNYLFNKKNNRSWKKTTKLFTTRPRSGFNLLCAETKSNGVSLREKMKYWKEKWAQLSDAEKRAYSTKAANVAGDVTNLSIRQRQNQVAKIMRVIQRYCDMMYSMGGEMVVIGSFNGSAISVSTPKGSQWMEENPHTINNFRHSMAIKSRATAAHSPATATQVPATATQAPATMNLGLPVLSYSSKKEEEEDLRERVKKMLNNKYAALTGLKFSKLNFASVRKGVVRVDGIPEECQPLIAPSKYSSRKLLLLLDAEPEITITWNMRNSKSASEPKPSSSTMTSATMTSASEPRPSSSTIISATMTSVSEPNPSSSTMTSADPKPSTSIITFASALESSTPMTASALELKPSIYTMTSASELKPSTLTSMSVSNVVNVTEEQFQKLMSTDLYDVHDISVEPDITGQVSKEEEYVESDKTGQDSMEEESVESNITGQDSMEEESVESDIPGQDSKEEESVESNITGQDSKEEESVESDIPGQDSMKEESVEPNIIGQDSMEEESVESDITGQDSMEEDDGKTRSICRKKKTQHTRRKAKLLNTRAKKIDRTPCVICKTQYFKSTVNWFICSACTKWGCANCTEKKRSKKPICKRCYKP